MFKELRNSVVKAAISALQAGDVHSWIGLFESNAVLLDDGHPRDLQRFSQEALGHEKFTTIENVSIDGLNLEGEFHSDTWGRFRTYFRFTISPSGKISKLEIGQA